MWPPCSTTIVLSDFVKLTVTGLPVITKKENQKLKKTQLNIIGTHNSKYPP